MVRRIIFEVLLWFVGRSKKYKIEKVKVEDYIRHLKLKANPRFEVKPEVTAFYREIDIEGVKGLMLEHIV